MKQINLNDYITDKSLAIIRLIQRYLRDIPKIKGMSLLAFVELNFKFLLLKKQSL